MFYVRQLNADGVVSPETAVAAWKVFGTSFRAMINLLPEDVLKVENKFCDPSDIPGHDIVFLVETHLQSKRLNEENCSAICREVSSKVAKQPRVRLCLRRSSTIFSASSNGS